MQAHPGTTEKSEWNQSVFSINMCTQDGLDAVGIQTEINYKMSLQPIPVLTNSSIQQAD